MRKSVAKSDTHDDEYGNNPIAIAHCVQGHYFGGVYPGRLIRTPQYSYTEYSVRCDLLACRAGLGHVILSHSPSDESITDKLHEDKWPSVRCMHPVE